MFGMGMPEILLILAIALIVIGPKKLPELAKSLGRAINEFKKATNELKASVEAEYDLKEVKKTFDDVKTTIKTPIDFGGKSDQTRKPSVAEGRVPETSETEIAPPPPSEPSETDEWEAATDLPAELLMSDPPPPKTTRTNADKNEVSER